MKSLRWWIVLMLFGSTVINYLDRQALSLLAPLLSEKFHMSNTDYSRVVFFFLLAYLIMQSGSGRLVDRWGTRLGMAVSVGWWSAAAMLHATASSTLGFGICRFLLGMGEAGNWPGAVKAISEWFSPRERAFATGLFNSGSTVGAVLAPPIIMWITLRWGWQSAFLLTGIAGFLWLIPWWLFYFPARNHPRLNARDRESILSSLSVPDSENASAHKTGWLDLLSRRSVWGLFLARMFADPVWWFYVFWLPGYLKQGRHFSLEMIGYFAWIPFFAAGVGSAAGGYSSGLLIKYGWKVTKARKAVMVGSALAMLTGIPAVLTGSAWLCLALISCATFAYAGWAANVLALPADICAPRLVGSVTGLIGSGAALGGMIFTALTGVVVDRFSFQPVFWAAGLLPLLAATFLVWLVDSRETH